MPASAILGPELFDFLRELERNNERPWFQGNKARYERDVRDPLLELIAAFAPRLRRISRNLVADPRPTGGSLFRIYRDTRFSRDKSPYKTWAAVHFRHERRRDLHAPGIYLHLQPDNTFVGAGIWHPDGATLKRIRDAIVDDPAGWKRVRAGRAFRKHFVDAGDSLKRPPRGYDPQHPLVDELKRKDFVVVSMLDDGITVRSDFPARLERTARHAAPYLGFLCRAIGVPF